MKKYNKVLILSVLGCTIAVGSVQASSWLDTGVSILKSQTETADTTETTSTSTTTETDSDISSTDMSSAFKEALLIGAEEVVSNLGQTNGFNDDAEIHIPLPDTLNTAKTLLDKAGLSSLTDDLELKLNRAAESATPMAKDLFVESISAMTFEDVMTIYQGPNDSATTYFKEKMSTSLGEKMAPIVETTLNEVGAIQAYDSVVSEYKTMPFVPDLKDNLNSYVVEKGMDGIFYYLAQKEIAIRENPVQQTTDLLKMVFGSN